MQDKLKEYELQRERLNCHLQDKENERQEIREKVLSVFDNDKEIFITYEDLRMFLIGERNEVNDGVVFEKTYEDDNKMVFITFLLDGGSFGVHQHDCIEFCKVLKGNLIETKRGYNRYSEGETIIYAKGELHKPYATVNSIYEVTFYKEIK